MALRQGLAGVMVALASAHPQEALSFAFIIYFHNKTLNAVQNGSEKRSKKV